MVSHIFQRWSIANKVCDERAAKEGVSISQYYMIGDNPSCDIKGGNNMGWTTILVRTGNFGIESATEQPKTIDKIPKTLKNDPENPADYVVDDFKAAIELILKKESIL